MNRRLLLYVENISPTSSEEHLIEYLEKWAPVQQVYFLREKQCTKRSIAAFVRLANESDLDLLLLRNQQNYRGKRLFMVRADHTQFFQADHSIIVRNITAKISEENLFEHFEECGKIAFLQIRTDDFAYVGFEDKLSVRNAINKNGMPLKGSNLKIQMLTRNIEIMIVNMDTLHSRMPELYRMLVHPAEPRKPGMVQQQQGVVQQQQQRPQQQSHQQSQQQHQPQQFENQQQYSQPAKQQQQFRNQYQQQQQTSNQQQQQFQNLQTQQQQTSNQQQYRWVRNEQQSTGNQHQQPQTGNQQQQFRNQQQSEYQQQQNQRQQQQQQQQRVQPQQQMPTQQQQQQQPEHKFPQQQPLPQRLPGREKKFIKLLEQKAMAMATKQQVSQQQKPPQQAPAVQPAAKAAPTAQEQRKKPEPVPAPDAPEDIDEVQIVEPTEIVEGAESDSEVQIVAEIPAPPAGIPPIPSAYQSQPNDVMRPIKASEISMSAADVKSEKDNRTVWVNHIPPETSRLDLVLYMEQFGDVEACKLGSSNNCYFTRWAKVTFISQDSARLAAEYFLHPFRGHYLFVLACNRCIDEMPGKVYVLDYLSKYLIYEDVVKAFKHVGEVFYLVRLLDNSYKVRIFFLEAVDAEAALAVNSIDGIPVNVEAYTEGIEMKIPKDQVKRYKNQREKMDPAKEARMVKILEIFTAEELERCDPLVNPDGKSERNEVLITNVHESTTDRQLIDYFEPIGDYNISIRREKDVYNMGCQRAYVEFRTLSMALKAAQLPAERTLNDFRPFIFPAWTKPHMTETNTVRLFFDSKEISVQDIYRRMIRYGRIRYVEKDRPKSALIVFDGHDDGIVKCRMTKGSFTHTVNLVGKEPYKIKELKPYEKTRGYFNRDCRRIIKDRRINHATKAERDAMQQVIIDNNKDLVKVKNLIFSIEIMVNAERMRRGDQLLPDITASLKRKMKGKAVVEESYVPPVKSNKAKESAAVDNEDDLVEVSNDSSKKTNQPNQNKKQANGKQQEIRRNPQNKRQLLKKRREPPPRRQGKFGRGRSRSPRRNQDQGRSMNPRDALDNNEPLWGDQQFEEQPAEFMPDDQFDRCNDDPFDNDDPPLDRGWGQQQQYPNRFSPPRQRSPFDRDFRDDGDLNFGRDSPEIPSDIPDDVMEMYIMRKQEDIKRRLEQLDNQLSRSVDSPRPRDYPPPSGRPRHDVIFDDNGDIHYVPIGAAGGGGRDRDRRGGGGLSPRRGPRRSHERQGSRDMNRRERGFQSPSPKRGRGRIGGAWR